MVDKSTNGDVDFTFAEGPSRRLLNERKRHIEGYRNVYTPAASISSFAGMLTDVLLEDPFVSGVVLRGMPEQVRVGRSAALQHFWNHRPLAVVDDYYANGKIGGVDESASFTIPVAYQWSDSQPLSQSFTTLFGLLCDLFAPAVEEHFPPGAWPGLLVRDFAALGSGNPNFGSTSLKQLCDSPQMGPLGCLAATAVLSSIWDSRGVQFGLRGLERLHTADFHRECETLLGKGTWSEKLALGAMHAFGSLGLEDRKMLAEMFAEQYSKAILEEPGKLAPTAQEHERTWLLSILDLIWEKDLRRRVDDALCDCLSSYDLALASKGLRFRDVFYDYGLALLHGQGAPTNCQAAVIWLERSARMGKTCAAYVLGACYERGKGCEVNLAEATQYYREAAEGGSAESQLALGRCLMSTAMKTKNAVEACAWLGLAAKQGHPEALGLCRELQKNMTEPEIRLARLRLDELCTHQTTNTTSCPEP